jgi:hypothetical protein
VKSWFFEKTNKNDKSLDNLTKIRREKSHEEMLNISDHKGNANQNHAKIPPHSC